MGRNEAATQYCPEGLQVSNDVEKLLQVADSFKFKFPSYPPIEVNEISTEESSGDKFEINERLRGKKWGNNNNYNQKRSNLSNSHSFGNRPKHNKQQTRKTLGTER